MKIENLYLALRDVNMKKFYALITGDGEGCDYTIGCNVNFEELKAETWIEARAEAKIWLRDSRVLSVRILECIKEADLFNKKNVE